MSDDVRPWDLIDPRVERASDDEARRRFNICKRCPELTETTRRCKQCGCFMFGKTKLKDATCPLGKW